MSKTHLAEKNSYSKELHKEDLEFLAKSNISIWKSALLIGALCVVIIALTAVTFDKEIFDFLIKM